jgi:L-threonylcarbamoyladenylate synthase
VSPSPGLSKRHYAPAARVRIAAAPALEGVVRELSSQGPVGVLALSAGDVPGASAVHRLSSDAPGYARDLYAALRDLEDRGCSAIAVEAGPDDPAWDAIRDRLARAAA